MVTEITIPQSYLSSCTNIHVNRTTNYVDGKQIEKYTQTWPTYSNRIAVTSNWEYSSKYINNIARNRSNTFLVCVWSRWCVTIFYLATRYYIKVDRSLKAARPAFDSASLLPLTFFPTWTNLVVKWAQSSAFPSNTADARRSEIRSRTYSYS